MTFKSLDELAEFFKGIQSKSDSAGTEQIPSNEAGEADHNPENCLGCQLAQLNQSETLLLANVNVAILEVMQNTLNQDAPIRNEQADTLVKLAQVKSILGSC